MATSPRNQQRDLGEEHPEDYPSTPSPRGAKNINVTIPHIQLPNIFPQFGALICQLLALILKTVEFVFELCGLVLRIADTIFTWVAQIANKGSRYLTAIAHKLH